jgi:hypothetical protein
LIDTRATGCITQLLRVRWILGEQVVRLRAEGSSSGSCKMMVWLEAFAFCCQIEMSYLNSEASLPLAGPPWALTLVQCSEITIVLESRGLLRTLIETVQNESIMMR